MIIVAGGDSHVWGSELADSPHGGPNGYSTNTFTALLAKGHTYICAAYPGINNFEIASRTKEQIYRSGANAVIICWTWPSRDTLYSSPNVILEFQQYCEYNDIPYIFTCVDNCLIELLDDKTDMEKWYMFPAGMTSGDTITPRGFYQWAIENKYNIGPDGHPLEQAHSDAVNLIKEKFNELVKKSI